MSDEKSTITRQDSVEVETALVSKYNQIQKKVALILEPLKPWSKPKRIQWSNFPLNLDRPRFGVIEAPDIKSPTTLLISNGLMNVVNYQLEWVLWREAVLEYLCPRVVMVKESADLGHYAGIKYGIKNREYKHRLHQIWESVSPSEDFGSYLYNPSIGFSFFDNVVDGTFLQRVIPWLNTFAYINYPMTSSTYTSILERWMFDYHRILKPIEVKVLKGLENWPQISQLELAERLGIRQSSISRILRNLSEEHLLRFVNYINLPIIGLQPIAVAFSIPNLKLYSALRKLLASIRYTSSIQEFNTIITAGFVIPFRRMRRFREWINKLTKSWGLPFPKFWSVTERFHSRNFSFYESKNNGWLLDYDSILDNVYRLIKEEWTSHMPSLKNFKIKKPLTTSLIELKLEDFIFMQRATDIFLLTDRVRSYEAKEARLAGYQETEHMAYRRRLEFLEEKVLLSPPLGIGLIHIGLNAIVNMLISGTEEITRRVLTAFQLLPHVAGSLFNDGNGSVSLLVPKPVAVTLKESLSQILHNCGIHAIAAVRPAWDSYGWVVRSPVNSKNYDFNEKAWIWTKDTLPTSLSVN